MRRIFGIITVLIFFSAGCVKKPDSLQFGVIETDEITEVLRNRYSVTKSVRINKAMKESKATQQLQQSMAEEVSQLCFGSENIVSQQYSFSDVIDNNPDMNKRERKRSQLKSGHIKTIQAYVTCQDDSVHHVSTKQLQDKQHQTILEIVVFADEIDIETYTPKLIKAVEDQAKKHCEPLNQYQIVYEFSAITVTGSGSISHPPRHTIEAIGDITCQ